MSEYKEQLIELFENVSGCSIDEFSEDQLPYLADYIIGQQEADNMCIEKLKKENQTLKSDMKGAIDLMSPSWQHAASKEPDLMTRYVTMAENQFKKKNEEIERLTAIATKHATRSDELYEALESTNKELYFLINELNKYRTKDVSCDQLDPPELHDMETCHLNAVLLDKSRIEAEGE